MPNNRFEFYQDSAKEWRWRIIAGNNKVVGASSEGFSSRQAAVKNARMNGYQGS